MFLNFWKWNKTVRKPGSSEKKHGNKVDRIYRNAKPVTFGLTLNENLPCKAWRQLLLTKNKTKNQRIP